MTFPSEAELIEFERRAISVLNGKRWEWRECAYDVCRLVELLRKCRDDFPYPHPVTTSESDSE